MSSKTTWYTWTIDSPEQKSWKSKKKRLSVSTVNHRFIHTLRLPSCNLNSTRDVKEIQDAPEKPKATINESRRSTFEACDVTKITGFSVSNVNHHFRHTLRLTSRSKWKRLKTLLRNVWNERKHATGNE